MGYILLSQAAILSRCGSLKHVTATYISHHDEKYYTLTVSTVGGEHCLISTVRAPDAPAKFKNLSTVLKIVKKIGLNTFITKF